MPDIHSIRLREPWKYEPRGEGALWTRTFNWPAGLTRREKVWVIVENLPSGARVTLNDQVLDSDFEVTSLIALHNRLEIELPGGNAAKFPCQVRLDIDEG
jgi:hypothetical protein